MARPASCADWALLSWAYDTFMSTTICCQKIVWMDRFVKAAILTAMVRPKLRYLRHGLQF